MSRRPASWSPPAAHIDSCGFYLNPALVVLRSRKRRVRKPARESMRKRITDSEPAEEATHEAPVSRDRNNPFVRALP